MPKRKIVLIAFVAANFIISYFLWRTLENGADLLGVSEVIWMFAATVLSLALLSLAVFLFERFEWYAMSLAFLAGFLAVFGVSLGSLGVSLAAVLFFGYAASLMRGVIKNRLTISFLALVYRGVPTLLTAVAALFAFASYAYVLHYDGLKVNTSLFGSIAPYLESFAQSRVPSYKKGMTVDEFLLASLPVEAQQAQKISPGLGARIDEEVRKQRENLGAQFGVSLRGDEKLAELLDAVANRWINRAFGAYKDVAVPAVVAVSVFLGVKSLGFLIDRISVACAWLLYRVLAAFGVVRKEKVAVEKEVLALT